MVHIKINGLEIEVTEGTSVLKAAEIAGVKVPALCFNEELGHFTSCMLCLVKDAANGRLFPSCSVTTTEGMSVITDDEEIHEARQTGLELLLSEHVGDCEGPCQVACPAHMDIPRMNRLIAAGKFEAALKLVKKDIALPAVLGRICPAPCEGACHRKTVDASVSICLLKRFVGDENNLHPYEPLPLNSKKVAVIGAGPAGLAAAYYLQLNGYQTVLYDKNDVPGGLLRTEIKPEVLPLNILHKEISTILNTGVVFEGGKDIDEIAFKNIKIQYDAVIVATGTLVDEIRNWGFTTNAKGIEANQNSYATSVTGVFAIGNSLRSSRLAVRSVGQGKEVAWSVAQYLSGEVPKGEPRLFNSRFGRLHKEEISEYLKESVPYERVSLADIQSKGYTKEEAIQEAKRCLHCDCRDIENCKLRDLSGKYDANQRRYAADSRKTMTKHFAHSIVYEPLKCIKCGICVRMTSKYQEKYGFSFIGRGFDVVIGVPFNESVETGLAETAEIVAKACPTGALSIKDKL
ncbi:MAG: 2Fe-2S iron-sulfur cluster-binding protein [Bacteroidia bacterium]|nr:2Fe-2S iron-sulfur cluster-binding protein [Bacteroidia bacterium]